MGWTVGIWLSVMEPLGIIPSVLPIPSGTLGWDGQLEFELSVMGPLGMIPSCPTNPKWYIGMGWTVGIWAISDGTTWYDPKLSYQSQVIHWDRMDSWDLSYQWWDQSGLSQVVLPIPSGTLGWDGQLGFELSVMEPVGTIPSCPANPKWYIGMGWTVGIWAISDGTTWDYPKLSYQSQVVHWDGMDSWDLSYQWWDQSGLSQVVLPIPCGTLGWDWQLRFELSVMGPLRTIPSCPTNPKWYIKMSSWGSSYR